MGDRIKAFWLGIFIIVAIALVGWLILFLKPTVGDGEVTLKVRFSNIDKVTEGTRVTFAGKPVGEVKDIIEVPDPRSAPVDESGNLYIYELILKVDSSVQVYTYDEIIFATSGLLGEKSIAIIPKATPIGAPPARNVTNEILYARSTDKLQETLTQLTQVAETFEETMVGINDFLNINSADFNIALKSFANASDEIHSFMSRANETDVAGRAAQASDSLITAMTKTETFIDAVQEQKILERMGKSFDNIHDVTYQISQGQGTLGKLINSDCLYIQVRCVLCQLESILCDIRNYGLLYQFDRKWQRTHDFRSYCTEMSAGD